MGTKTFIVDSFTDEKFKGNPAGVCLLEKDLPVNVMLSIAQELGFSETAFVRKKDGVSGYSIRFFTPKIEIPLCGHATLAAAKVIFRDPVIDQVQFTNIEDLDLFISRNGEEITMAFPVYNTVSFSAPGSMLEALGLQEINMAVYSEKNKIVLLEIADSDILAGLNPNFNALLNSYQNINGVLVTAPSRNKKYDYQYRYFWPWVGTNEDPVTGGVQTFLAKYWSEKFDKKKMTAFQSSSRSGYMSVELQNDKVLITSMAVITFEGELLLN